MDKKILIIDDEPDLLEAIKIRLESQDYEVITARDGEIGLKKIREERPNLVILDIVMPGMDGYQVCEKIKKAQDTKNIPVIMLTAKNMGEDFEKAVEKEADWYIAKPFNYRHLLKTISNLLKESE